jgi:hypothetical protein
MVAVAKLFRRALDRQLEAEESAVELAALLPAAVFSNGFLMGDCGAVAATVRSI